MSLLLRLFCLSFSVSSSSSFLIHSVSPSLSHLSPRYIFLSFFIPILFSCVLLQRIVSNWACANWIRFLLLIIMLLIPISSSSPYLLYFQFLHCLLHFLFLVFSLLLLFFFLSSSLSSFWSCPNRCLQGVKTMTTYLHYLATSGFVLPYIQSSPLSKWLPPPPPAPPPPLQPTPSYLLAQVAITTDSDHLPVHGPLRPSSTLTFSSALPHNQINLDQNQIRVDRTRPKHTAKDQTGPNHFFNRDPVRFVTLFHQLMASLSSFLLMTTTKSGRSIFFTPEMQPTVDTGSRFPDIYGRRRHMELFNFVSRGGRDYISLMTVNNRRWRRRRRRRRSPWTLQRAETATHAKDLLRLVEDSSLPSYQLANDSSTSVFSRPLSVAVSANRSKPMSGF